MIYNLGKNNNTRDIAYFGSSSDYNNFKIRNTSNFSESSALTINANKINKNIILSIGEISNYFTNGANNIESILITDVNLNPDREYIQKIIIYDNTNNRYDYIYVKFLKQFNNNNWYLNFFKLDNTGLSANITILPFTITYSGENTNYIEGNIFGSNFPYNWIQRGADIDGEAAGDNSGYSISLSSDGSIVAIGAAYNDGNGSDSGHVRVYEWNGTAWLQRGTDIDGEEINNLFGYSVSLSSDGSIVAIGAAYNNNVNGSESGHVRVYRWNETAWVKLGADIDGEAANDYSGYSVSLSSNGYIVAIGATYNDGVNGVNSGHVRVYHWNGTAWVKRGSDIDGEAADNRFGHSVSLSDDGSIVAIGAIFNNGTGDQSGHVRVYHWNETAWDQRGTDIDGEVAYDNSGYSVSLSSDGYIVAIGAAYNDGNGLNSGHVRVYHWNGTSWVKRGADIDGEAAGDVSGWSVSLSSDGSIVAIGAVANDGVTGLYNGHVRVFHWNETAWVQVGADIDGEAPEDWSGYSVSLSSDGSIVAIGAAYNDGTGTDSGHVRVYAQKL